MKCIARRVFAGLCFVAAPPFGVALAAIGCGSDSKPAKARPTRAGDADAGSDAGASPTDGGSAFDAGGDGGSFPLTSTTLSGTVALPDGVSVAPDSLRVLTSLGDAQVSASGDFSVDAFAAGPQLVTVLTAADNPLLLGFIDGAHTRIDAESTAEVMLWFASLMPLLPADSQTAALDALPTTPGLDSIAQAITTSLAADPEAFGSPNMPVSDALSRAVLAFLPTIQDIIVDPGATTPQSGVSVEEDQPFAAHLRNRFRRRAWAYVRRVSETDKNGVTLDPFNVTDFEVTPVNGFNKGITGTIANLFDAAYGNDSLALLPVDSPRDPSTNLTLPFTVPWIAGAKTTYKVTVVGPGSSEGDAYATLDGMQKSKRVEVCLSGFLQDVLLPIIGNIVFGAKDITWDKGFEANWQRAAVNLAKNLTKELTTKMPQILPLVEKGDYGGAMRTLFKDPVAFGVSGVGRAIVQDAFSAIILQQSKSTGVRFSWDQAGKRSAFKAFNALVTNLNGYLQAFDTGVFLAELNASHFADSWTVDVARAKVVLNPAMSTVHVGDMTLLTASLPNVDKLDGYSFKWTNTENGGDLVQVGAGAQTTSKTSPSFCASSPQVNYLAATSNKSDTVTVEVFDAASCGATKGKGMSLGTAKATIAITNAPVTPTCDATATVDGVSTCYPADQVYTHPFNDDAGAITGLHVGSFFFAWSGSPTTYGSPACWGHLSKADGTSFVQPDLNDSFLNQSDNTMFPGTMFPGSCSISIAQDPQNPGYITGSFSATWTSACIISSWPVPAPGCAPPDTATLSGTFRTLAQSNR